ncbi:MAG: lysine-specific histone demethylase 1 [Circular genetic element sp.]|nr:MAG: lysine-specific histone demethylase 1 [Circular genetic element sp.]
MNKYKEEWMHQCMMLPLQAIESVTHELEQQQRKLDQNYKLAKAMNRTAKAALVGAGIAAIDGPIPVMDLVGLGVGSTMALIAWHDYFS